MSEPVTLPELQALPLPAELRLSKLPTKAREALDAFPELAEWPTADATLDHSGPMDAFLQAIGIMVGTGKAATVLTKTSPMPEGRVGNKDVPRGSFHTVDPETHSMSLAIPTIGAYVVSFCPDEERWEGLVNGDRNVISAAMIPILSALGLSLVCNAACHVSRRWTVTVLELKRRGEKADGLAGRRHADSARMMAQLVFNKSVPILPPIFAAHMSAVGAARMFGPVEIAHFAKEVVRMIERSQGGFANMNPRDREPMHALAMTLAREAEEHDCGEPGCSGK